MKPRSIFPLISVRSPALLVFCVEVHASFRGSFHRFHGTKLPWKIWKLPWKTNPGSFHGAFAKASMEKASMAVVEDAAEVTPTEASTEAPTKASTETSTKVSTEELPRKFLRIRTLPRKHLHGFLGFSSVEASGSFHGRSEAQRLPRKLFVKASTKIWKLHPRILTFYFNGNFRSSQGISAASTTAPTGIFVFYPSVPPVELATFSTTWLTHTV